MDRIVGLACTALDAMAPIFAVLPLAADQDTELQILVTASEASLRHVAGEVVRLLADGNAVHDDAVDQVYVLLRSQTFLTLVRTCGWSVERYGAWLRRALLAAAEPAQTSR